MRPPPTGSRSLRFALAAVALAVVSLGATFVSVLGVGCGPNLNEIWVCLNPVTGFEDPNVYDQNHYVNGVFDPCHCYDPCGPEKSCPMAVDAGPPPADAGCMEGGNDGDGGA